eukprot:COSAG04_NODE_5208_length_1702_cov_1.638178_3_plen_301_part_01
MGAEDGQGRRAGKAGVRTALVALGARHPFPLGRPQQDHHHLRRVIPDDEQVARACAEAEGDEGDVTKRLEPWPHGEAAHRRLRLLRRPAASGVRKDGRGGRGGGGLYGAGVGGRADEDAAGPVGEHGDDNREDGRPHDAALREGELHPPQAFPPGSRVSSGLRGGGQPQERGVGVGANGVGKDARAQRDVAEVEEGRAEARDLPAAVPHPPRGPGGASHDTPYEYCTAAKRRGLTRTANSFSSGGSRLSRAASTYSTYARHNTTVSSPRTVRDRDEQRRPCQRSPRPQAAGGAGKTAPAQA